MSSATSTPLRTTPVTSSMAQSISHPAYGLLKRAHSPTRATQIFTDKVKNKPLLLAPSNIEAASKDNRSLRRHIRLRKKQYYTQHVKPRPLSAKEKRQLHLHDLAPEEIKYDLYRGLNRMWTGYILEVLNLTDSKGELIQSVLSSGAAGETKQTINVVGHGSLLAAADFHGMNVEVVRCVDVGRVGLKGIVVRETRSTLVIITPRDKAVRMLKKGAVFKVAIDLKSWVSASYQQVSAKTMGDVNDGHEKSQENEHEHEHERKLRGKATMDLRQSEGIKDLVFELHGSQLEIRPVERAVKKFKWHNFSDL